MKEGATRAPAAGIVGRVGRGWQETSHREGFLAIQAGKQHGLITTQQLLECGITQTAIDKRVHRGRLFRVHRGVFSLTPPPLTKHQVWLAAVLAYGPHALLSDISSAELCGYADTSSLIAHVAVPDGSGRHREGVSVHRRAVDPRDVRRKDGILCTSADRTLIDLAPHRTESELETLLVAAESLRLLKRNRLAELINERRGRPGMAKLASIIALEPAFVRSDPELLFLPIWREAGIERPLVNYPIQVEGQVLEVDFAWPSHDFVVELDSQRFHGDWESAERDRRRDLLLALAGRRTQRFTRAQCREDRSTIARLLAGFLPAARPDRTRSGGSGRSYLG